MLTKPMDVLSRFPVRKTKQQKQAFREAVLEYAEKQGYSAAVEKGSFGVRNVVIGDPEKAKYLVTAHYDTCAVLPVPNLITPCNFLPYLGYQLFLTVLIMVVCIVLGVAISLLIGPTVGIVVTYLSVWVLLAMMLIGPANKHNANDNTSGVVTVLEIARTMPENQRHKAWRTLQVPISCIRS